MVSNGVVGGTGVFSPLASVAPKLARELYDLCQKQQFTQAREGPGADRRRCTTR